MDYLARRDHSELELRQKLRKLDYEESAVEKALVQVKERGWLLPADELAIKVARRLSEKGKGQNFIRSYLRRLGLPDVEKSPEIEEKRARELIERKWSPKGKLAFEEQQKAFRFLQARGFDYETIKKVIYERFGDPEEFC